jgi:hypothetical protein
MSYSTHVSRVSALLASRARIAAIEKLEIAVLTWASGMFPSEVTGINGILYKKNGVIGGQSEDASTFENEVYSFVDGLSQNKDRETDLVTEVRREADGGTGESCPICMETYGDSLEMFAFSEHSELAATSGCAHSVCASCARRIVISHSEDDSEVDEVGISQSEWTDARGSSLTASSHVFGLKCPVCRAKWGDSKQFLSSISAHRRRQSQRTKRVRILRKILVERSMIKRR